MILMILTCSLLPFVLSQLRSLMMILCRIFLKNTNREPLVLPLKWPLVVVQLPTYREQSVLRRLITSVLAMEYPAGCLQVQVLDDSEGHNALESQRIVAEFKDHPVKITYLYRGSRHGFKSGALNYGNQFAAADLVAVFDADFEPSKDFLLKTVPFFQQEQVAAVQTRWGYTNETASSLTRIQAAIFDKMFVYELDIRRRLGMSAIFLGTSGIWRKSAIESLGGWQEEPFTSEDIDLTYRASCAGYKIEYLPKVLSQSELPDTYLAYKSQQRRWARGVFRVFLDHWLTIIKAFKTPKKFFIELSLVLLQLSMPMIIPFLLASFVYVCLGLPRTGYWIALQLIFSTMIIASPTLMEFMLAQYILYSRSIKRCLQMMSGYSLLIGLSVSLMAGFMDTLFARQKEFIRTPKYGAEGLIKNSKRKWINGHFPIAWIEVFLGLVAVMGGTVAMMKGYYESLMMFGFLAGGYLFSGYTSMSELFKSKSVPVGQTLTE